MEENVHTSAISRRSEASPARILTVNRCRLSIRISLIFEGIQHLNSYFPIKNTPLFHAPDLHRAQGTGTATPRAIESREGLAREDVSAPFTTSIEPSIIFHFGARRFRTSMREIFFR